MPEDMRQIDVSKAPEHLATLFAAGTPERYVVDQMREILKETWVHQGRRNDVLAGMTLALHMIALWEEKGNA